MIQFKIAADEMLKIINILSNINNNIHVWFSPERIIFSALDPMRSATVMVILDNNIMQGYKCDINKIFTMNIQKKQYLNSLALLQFLVLACPITCLFQNMDINP